ncbi:MAG: S1 RNA-binding domain-containing protein, partial [Myxococcota bacterium]
MPSTHFSQAFTSSALVEIPPALLDKAEQLNEQPASAWLSCEEAVQTPIARLRTLLIQARLHAKAFKLHQEAKDKGWPVTEELHLSDPTDLDFLETCATRWSDELSRGTVKTELLAYWFACRKLVWREANLHTKVVNQQHDRFFHYAHLTGNQGRCKDVRAHRWFAIRQGTQEGILSLHWRWPDNLLEKQKKLYHQRFVQQFSVPTNNNGAKHTLFSEEDIQRFSDALHIQLEKSLRCALQAQLQSQSQSFALEYARKDYFQRLTQSPYLEILAALALDEAQSQITVLILDSEGRLLNHQEFPMHEHMPQALHQWLEKFEVNGLVIPLRMAQEKNMQEILETCTLLEVFKVPEAGLAHAREQWQTEPWNMSRPLANARVLAHRIQAPFEAWSALDPEECGLVEYIDQIEEDSFRFSFEDERSLARHALQFKKLDRLELQPTAKLPKSKLNPLVKSLNDLRSGMLLDGTVSHTTDFGAFVNIGLKQEGMVHISELSEQFVKHPRDVVSSGQSVRVRVLSVDLSGPRIALSMKMENNKNQ